MLKLCFVYLYTLCIVHIETTTLFHLMQTLPQNHNTHYQTT